MCIRDSAPRAGAVPHAEAGQLCPRGSQGPCRRGPLLRRRVGPHGGRDDRPAEVVAGAGQRRGDRHRARGLDGGGLPL
eukprot:3284496-Alexandrium_andersonii.AAC.1